MTQCFSKTDILDIVDGTATIHPRTHKTTRSKKNVEKTTKLMTNVQSIV